MQEEQKRICDIYKSEYQLVSLSDYVIFEGNEEHLPIIGCKVSDWDASGEEILLWCITCGEANDHGFDESNVRITVEELLKKVPQVMPYLGLSEEFNFIIDEEGEVDVFTL